MMLICPSAVKVPLVCTSDFRIQFAAFCKINMCVYSIFWRRESSSLEVNKNKTKTDPLRAMNILMRKGMSHTAVSAT